MSVPPTFVYGLTGLFLFVVGLAGLISCAQLLRKILAVNIMASGVFLFLVTIAHGDGVVIPGALSSPSHGAGRWLSVVGR